MNQLALFASPNLPALLTTAQPQTQTRFSEFCGAQIRNKKHPPRLRPSHGRIPFLVRKARHFVHRRRDDVSLDEVERIQI